MRLMQVSQRHQPALALLGVQWKIHAYITYITPKYARCSSIAVCCDLGPMKGCLFPLLLAASYTVHLSLMCRHSVVCAMLLPNPVYLCSVIDSRPRMFVLHMLIAATLHFGVLQPVVTNNHYSAEVV